MLTIIYSVLGTIAAAIITGLAVSFWTKRRLYVVVPQLFSHSNISQDGKLVEISILNKGRKTETNVQIIFDRSLTYDIVASTIPGLELKESNVLEIERLSAGDECSVLLTAEGGSFSKSSIASVSSDEAKGRMLSKSTEAISALDILTGTTALALLFTMPVVGFFAGAHLFGDEKVFGAGFSGIEIPEELTQTGWEPLDRFVNSSLFDPENPGYFPVSLGEWSREENVVSLPIRIENRTDERLEFSIELISPARSLPEARYQSGRYFSSLIIFPGETIDIISQEYLPEDYARQLLIVEINIQYSGPTIYSVEKTYELNVQRK